MAHYSGHQVVAITVSFSAIAFTIVALRLFTRFFLTRNAGTEDFCVALAMLLSIALTVTICEQVKYGMGQHIYDLSVETLIKSQKPFWASIWIYNLALSFTKASMLIQYLRIFTIKSFRVACCSVFAFLVAYSLWTFFGSIFLCLPVTYFWDKTIEGGRCMNQFAVWFTNASLNIATDFAIIILPMPVLKSLNLPRRQKRALTLVFTLGGFVCIVSILRLHSLVAISNSKDPTYDNPPAATWSSIETNVGIICACLPSLRPLLSRIFPKIFATAFRPSQYYPNAGYEKSGTHRSQISSDIKFTSFKRTSTAVSGKEEEEDSILGFQTKVETPQDTEKPSKIRKGHDGKPVHGTSGSNELSDRFGRTKYEDHEITVVTTVEQSIELKVLVPLPILEQQQPQVSRLQQSLPNIPASIRKKPSADSFRRKGSEDEMSERRIVLERSGV